MVLESIELNLQKSKHSKKELFQFHLSEKTLLLLHYNFQYNTYICIVFDSIERGIGRGLEHLDLSLLVSSSIFSFYLYILIFTSNKKIYVQWKYTLATFELSI